MNLLPDVIALMKAIKRTAVEAVEAEKPVKICFGRVTGVSPLQISVEQKMTLGKQQLVLTRNVTDYKVLISGGNVQDYCYEGEAPETHMLPVSPSHTHAIGNVEVTVYNGLAVGDEVVLLRQQGGQKYIVADRVV